MWSGGLWLPFHHLEFSHPSGILVFGLYGSYDRETIAIFIYPSYLRQYFATTIHITPAHTPNPLLHSHRALCANLDALRHYSSLQTPLCPPPPSTMYSFLISSSPVLYLNSLVFGLPGPKSSPPPAYLQILFFGSLLTLTRFLWDHLILVPNGWQTATDDKERECLGGLVALTHSTLLLGPLFGLLMTHPTMKPSSQFSDSPPKWNYVAKTLISYTTSYMLQDAFWMLYYSTDPSQSAYPSPGENDMMFLLHHLATILYMSSCRYIDAGHYSAMWLMWLGEVTNPVHNVYLLLEYARVNHPGENVEVLFFYFSKGEGDDVRVAQFTSFIDEFIISNIVASLLSSPLLLLSLRPLLRSPPYLHWPPRRSLDSLRPHLNPRRQEERRIGLGYYLGDFNRGGFEGELLLRVRCCY